VKLATSGKIFFASLASGRTRRSKHFRCNLLNSDTDRHSTVRPDAEPHGICIRDRAWQGIFLLDTQYLSIFFLDAAVSGHFPSGCSHVIAFSFWMQPCQGIFLLDTAMLGQMASGQRVSWHCGYARCQDMEHRSKYSRCICKHAAGSRHSDSVQFNSLYLMFIYKVPYGLPGYYPLVGHLATPSPHNPE